MLPTECKPVQAPLSILSNEYLGFIPCWEIVKGLILITHLHLVPKLGVHGATLLLLHAPSCRVFNEVKEKKKLGICFVQTTGRF
jgi:hypothetical protein